VKRRTRWIAHRGGDIRRLRGHHRNQPVRSLGPSDSREPIANHPVLLLKRIEHFSHRGDHTGRSEQPQRVTGRGGIDHDDVVWRCAASPARLAGLARAHGRRESRDFKHRGELVDARQ